MIEPLWHPNPDRIDGSNLSQFMARLGREGGYDAFWEWSVSDLEGFWDAAWDELGIVGEMAGPVLRDADQLEKARFFPDCKVNLAENLLQVSGGDDALIFHGENGTRRVFSFDALRDEVAKLQSFLRDQGVGIGDRVAGFVPNTPEALIAMLAASSLGAVWSSCSPDFGVAGVMDRFGQIEPKVLFSSDKYHYNGKTIVCAPTASEVADALPSVKALVVFAYDGGAPDIAGFGSKAVAWTDAVEDRSTNLHFERVNFDAPMYVMFSSGTTGLPKCIVHSVGGTLIQHQKEHQLQGDTKPGDRLFYFTTCGWMMWNWKVSALGAGASLVMYDGSPFFPDGNRCADIVEAEGVTHFGTSAKFLDACAKENVAPIKSHDLSNLRTIYSTGSPLAPAGFEYVYSHWKKDLCLSSVAGGTDILGCFVGGSPIDPVYSGQCQKRQLAMDVRVFNADGQHVEGEQGELVCVKPHPSMPVGFWNDPDGEKYHNAYFAKFENVWHHGDFVELTPQGGMVFYGRSDAVLNPGGVRIGTAEIYRQVEQIDEVLEGLVIGQQWQDDVRVVLFVRLAEGVALDEALVKKIKSEIRTNCTPRHMPAKIIAVADIPRTKSGKITELAVRDIVHGRTVKNTDAMANPEALELYKDLPELQS
ncbi:MAG: acetoacetate--CoA ligase [Pseudomonadota bacterium]